MDDQPRHDRPSEPVPGLGPHAPADGLPGDGPLGAPHEPPPDGLGDAPREAPSDPPLVVATVVGPPHRAARPHRWWTPLAICGLSLASFMAATLFITLVALVVVHGSLDLQRLRDGDGLAGVMRSRLGLFLLVVVPQLALVLPSIAAGILSPVETRRRLGWVRGHWPLWVWAAAALATPLIGLVSGIAVSLLMDESQLLNEMASVFRDHGQGGFLIPLAIMIGMTPALCEELLFRGYMQTRLTQAFGPLIGILACSILFAAFHMDLVHVVAVLPLGLYLGWVTWQSGSLFPAILGHFVNNALSVVLVVYDPSETPDVLAAPAMVFMVGILAFGAAGMAAVGYAAIVFPRPAAS